MKSTNYSIARRQHVKAYNKPDATKQLAEVIRDSFRTTITRGQEKSDWADRILTFSERLKAAKEYAFNNILLEREYPEHFVDVVAVDQKVRRIKSLIRHHETELIGLQIELNKVNQYQTQSSK